MPKRQQLAEDLNKMSMADMLFGMRGLGIAVARYGHNYLLASALCLPCSLATIDNDVFWHNSSLQHAHFGMVATPSEETWRLNLEVGNPFFVIIHDTKTIFF